MKYLKITTQNEAIFHSLMTHYYREGEDRDTPQEEIDGFIHLLFHMLEDGAIHGRPAAMDGQVIGFILYAKDTAALPFSEIPGYGTILETGLAQEFRKQGYGQLLVQFAEVQLKAQSVAHCYVSAYGPAQSFWEHCGYRLTGNTAANGLPLLVKSI